MDCCISSTSSQQQQQQQPQDGRSQLTDAERKHRAAKRRNRRRSRGILSVIVSGEPVPGDEDSSEVSDSSSDDVMLPSARRRLGRGYHSRPKTERLTSSTPRGQFISQRERTAAAFQAVRCSSMTARNRHAVDAVTSRKWTLCPVSHTVNQPAPSAVSETGPSYEVTVAQSAADPQPIYVIQADDLSFSGITCRQKYSTWPLDARSMPDPLEIDPRCIDVCRPSHVGRLQRQNAVELMPPSTVDLDQLSRPSVATSASRSTGNVSIDNKPPDVTLKPPTPLHQQQRESQHFVEPEGVTQAERSEHISAAAAAAAVTSTAAGHDSSTFGPVTLSLPRMSVTAFWNFVMSRYGRSDPRTEAERLRRKQQKKKENRARKALRTITIILGAFVLCWTPWHSQIHGPSCRRLVLTFSHTSTKPAR